MTTFLFHFHSGLRWILVLGIIIALVRYAAIWMTAGEFRPFDKTITVIVTALFDVQLLIGIVLLYVMTSGFSVLLRHHMEHAATMLLAVVAVHLPMRWKSKPASERARASFILLIIATILVIAGVARLPQGWHF